MKVIEILKSQNAYHELRQKFLGSHPWGNLLTFETAPSLPENWTEAKGVAYLSDPDLVDYRQLEAHEEPQEVREANICDSLLLQQGHWWPRIFMRQAFRTVLVQKAPSLSNQDVAYVTGCGGWARFSCVMAIQIGFRRVCLVCSDEAARDKMAQELTRQYFQVEMTGIPENELTLQPNNGSLLVNTQSHEANETLIEDLSYLNFLRAEGLVVDFDAASKDHNLLVEAINIGDKAVHPFELFGARDALFFAEILQESDPKTAEHLVQYQKDWTKFLDEQRLFQSDSTKV